MSQTSINIRTDEVLKTFTISAVPSFMVNTIEELDANIREGLADIAAGNTMPIEEAFRKHDLYLSQRTQRHGEETN